jgi:hypothetical protein
MLEGSLIIEGAAWRVRALRLMELDIDRFSTVLRTTRRARRGDVLAYFSSLDLKPRATCTSNSRSAGPDPELSLRYGPRPERSTGHGGRRGDRPVGSPFSAHAALNRLCTCVSTTALRRNCIVAPTAARLCIAWNGIGKTATDPLISPRFSPRPSVRSRLRAPRRARRAAYATLARAAHTPGVTSTEERDQLQCISFLF